MSSRSTVGKLKIAPKPAPKKSEKLARIAKFPKVGKHAQKPAPKKAQADSAKPGRVSQGRVHHPGQVSAPRKVMHARLADCTVVVHENHRLTR